MSELDPDALFAWLLPEAEALKRRYRLDAWSIALRVVNDEELHPDNAAEVAIREEYRSATIYLARSLVENADRDTLLAVLDHEIQHVFLHPLDALKSLVLDAVPDALRVVVTNEFGRANERVRASLESLLDTRPAEPTRLN